jgi:hypothetical protein
VSWLSGCLASYSSLLGGDVRGLAYGAPLGLVVGALGYVVVVAVVVAKLLLLMRLILSPRALYSSLLCLL